MGIIDKVRYAKGVARYGIESIYAKRLGDKRKDEFMLNENKYGFIKECARKAYSGKQFYPYDDYLTFEEFIYNWSAGIGQFYVFTGNNWYIIFVDHIFYIYLIDFASSSRKCTEIFSILRDVKHLFMGKVIKAICLENTSYPLVLLLERRKVIKIIKDKAFEKEHCVAHEVTAVLLSK